MKQEFYPESSIREQIEAGVAEDWQIQMGGYVVSLYYTKSPKSGVARIVPFRRADRLSVIVYRQMPDGTKEAIRQIKVPARNANLWTDHRNSLRVVAHDGRMCIFFVTASGGLVTGPGTGTSDSVPAMLSNGEAVMTAAAVNEWGAMLSAMNVSSGGNAINVSNLPQRGDGMRGMRAMLKEALLDMPAPVVSVVDINKGQRKVQVQDNISKLGRKKYK